MYAPSPRIQTKHCREEKHVTQPLLAAIPLISAPSVPTSETQLTVTNTTVLCGALFFMFTASSVPLDTLVELAPAMPSSVFLQTFFFGPSVLKPDLEPQWRKKMFAALQHKGHF